MRALIVIVLFSVILAPAAPLSFHAPLPPRSNQLNQPVQWTDSVNNGSSEDSPPMFSFIGNIQKFLDAKKIGFGLEGDRYEVFYKRIY